MSDAQVRPAWVWDLPTRIVHWLMAILIGVSWITAETHRMDWHRWSGYAVLGLVVFRLYWGFAGSETARFASFVRGPRAVAAYARTLGKRAPSQTVGHNPLGALSVVAMLALIATQVSLGLFAVDIDGLESGPLSHLVDFDTGRVFAGLHELSFKAIQVLVVLHLAAIAYYAVFKRENLVGAMITGRRLFSRVVSPGGFAPAWRAVLGVVLAAGIAAFIARGLKI